MDLSEQSQETLRDLLRTIDGIRDRVDELTADGLYALAVTFAEQMRRQQPRGAVDALREVLRVVEGAERGEPFGTEDMALPRLPYIGDVVRDALQQPRGAVEVTDEMVELGARALYSLTPQAKRECFEDWEVAVPVFAANNRERARAVLRAALEAPDA